jgi:hypothetical protein
MVKIKVGHWYLSKKGALCRVDEIPEEGEITVTAHYSGSRIKIPHAQAEFFTETSAPDIGPGMARMSSIPKKKVENYEALYDKYPHIVKESIYIVKSMVTPTEQLVKIDGKARLKKNKVAKGSTRCKIKCQTHGCKGTRDIKVQDAFQVKFCDKCKSAKKKDNLEKFLKKVKS